VQSELNFRYRCRDQNGKDLDGIIQAASTAVAVDKLRQKGWSLLQLSPISNRRLDLSSSTTERPAGKLQLSQRQLTSLCLQLATLMESGLGLLRSLDAIAQSGDRPGFLCDQLARGLEQGQSLSEVLQDWPEIFDPSFVATIRVGESTGRMAHVIRALAQNLEGRSLRRSRLLASLTYPAMLTLACLAMMVFMMAVLLPQLSQLIPSNLPPPWPTRMVLWLNQLPLIPLTLGGLAALAGLWVQLNSTQGRGLREWLLRGPFPWSAHFRRSLWLDLTQSLQLLFSSGMPAAQILPCLFPASASLEPVLQRSQQRFLQGSSLADSLAAEPGAPRLLVSFLEIGESVGRIEHFLGIFVRLSGDELEEQRETWLALLEPCLLLSLGGVVGFVVMASFLPAYQLLSLP
jgi:type II secretory pathway component PulF